MKRREKSGSLVPVLYGAALVLAYSGSAVAQQEPAVLSGVQYLKSHYGSRPPGEMAMIALGLVKAEVPHSDPALQACVASIRSRFAGSDAYEPQLSNGSGTYEAAAAIMALANFDPVENLTAITAIAAYIKGRQNANGSWDYNGRGQGDTSISQYAVLGLWEAENAGVDVAPSTWDHAAEWYMSVQSSGGSWNYHRDEGSARPETVSMTAAGVGSLLICQRQLERYRQSRRGTSSLLTALGAESSQVDYRPSTTNAQIEQAIKRGIAWIGSNFVLNNRNIVGTSPYYGLYGIERVGALGERQTIGRLDWYAKGRDFIISTQRPDGSWNGDFGAEMNTVWAMLFLTKSTAKTIRKINIQRLGAGTLLGGRELPKDLSSMTVAGGRVVSRPMNGAIEGMLAVLDDPRAEQADAAVSGIVERYYAQGPEALRPHKIRFRKMLADRDHGIRRVAAWALARTGDLDVVPPLIDAMVVPNEEEEVVAAIRMGLELLSRKIKGLGPPSPSTPDDRIAAARKWREWYQAIRPLDLEGQDEDSGTAGVANPPATAGAPTGSTPK
jgi:Prenyltransferase and squalene oxidase repeat